MAFTKGRMSHLQLSNGEVMTYDKTITNINSNFNFNGEFICQTAGLYMFHFYAVTKSDEHVWLEMFKNDQYIVSIYGRTPNDYVDAGNSVLLNLAKGDLVYIKARDQYDNVIFGAGDQVYTTFTGVLLAGIQCYFMFRSSFISHFTENIFKYSNILFWIEHDFTEHSFSTLTQLKILFEKTGVYVRHNWKPFCAA